MEASHAFYKVSEENTGMSPSDLLDRYKILIEELENHDQFEWIYEGEEKTFSKIHKLLHLEELKDNLLNQHFEGEIVLLDKHIILFVS